MTAQIIQSISVSTEHQISDVGAAFRTAAGIPITFQALPTTSDETQQQYRDFLTAHLTFPFNASYWSDLTPYSETNKYGEVVGFAAPSVIDVARGILCEVRREQAVEQAPLVNMELDEDDPNSQYVEDYQYWHEDVQECLQYDEYEDEFWEEEDEEEGDEEEEYEDDAYEPHEGDRGPQMEIENEVGHAAYRRPAPGKSRVDPGRSDLYHQRWIASGPS